MKYLKLIKLNNKKLIAVAALVFFVLFLNIFGSVAYAQDYSNVGSYDTYSNIGSYDSYGNIGSYSYPSTYYYGIPGYSTYIGEYTYPSTYYSNVPTYSTSIGGYDFPTTYYSNVPTYSTSIGGYTYPSTYYSSVPTYSTSVGNYIYPAYAYSSAPTAEAATFIQPIVHAASASTGPEHAWLWTLLGGLMLSAVIYSVLFMVRFRKQFAFTGGAGANNLLELKIAEIRNKELKPDTEIAIC